MKITNLKTALFGLIATFCLLPISSHAADSDVGKFDLSTGHFGAELDMMPGGPEQGSMLPFITWENDKYVFSLGGNYYETSDKINGPTNYWQGETRASYRFNILPNSFIDVGVDYSWQWGRQNGQSMGTNFSTGPMIGFSRQFTGTNVFFTAFVVVAQYVRMDAPAQSTDATGWGFFNNGGVGVRYLFGN